jgi:hypothetical protein
MYLNSYERQDTMFKLSLVPQIFLVLLPLGLFLILAAQTSTRLGRLSRWVGYFATEPFMQVIILYLLMLGTLVSSISST